MIRNVIFDMGNVLLSFDPEIPLQLFCKSEESRNLIRRELFQGPEWEMGDYGYLTNAQRYEPVSRRIPAGYHSELKKCVDGWDVCMKPIPGALAFCEQLKKEGYGIYVLSNADNTFYSYFPRIAPVSYFDGVMVSSDIHMVKPSDQIYQHFLQTYALSPASCLFIDDRPENIEGARRAGMEGFLFTGDFQPVRLLLDRSATLPMHLGF